MADTLQPPPPHVIAAAVHAALEEDGAEDDVTTTALVNPEQWGRGVFVAKDDGVVAGLPLAAAAMTAIDESVSFDTLVADGMRVSAGAELAEVEGPVAMLLASERVALNFLQRLSGIATLTRAYVDAVAGTGARILDTRKTTPGLRHLERYAVRAGGGSNHRFNLSTGVLIKDNHIAAARLAGLVDLAQVVERARARAPHTVRVEVEVTSIEQIKDALEGGADVILLDNMTVDEIRAAVELIAGRAIVEASGGITLENVRAVAETGVQLISVGRLTHSAPALDISLELGGI
ncbi:MAG: carboxylating nicotinate-nucleotide diphosphorylase [Dehalococcoidia bacterium]|nr:MAG: carboxylating nicotinate-nucleotide diphosphorylase [Dehalococcoidia bacterium]